MSSKPPSILHDDWANNMTSRVFLVKTDRPSGSHNDGLSKFHENKANHVTAREADLEVDEDEINQRPKFHWANVLTKKTALAHGDHAFKQTKNLPEISFKQIICPMLTRETNLPLAAIKYVLSKFQTDRQTNRQGTIVVGDIKIPESPQLVPNMASSYEIGR
ncbi:hypothetical protein DPMN_007578 [Dreissena polymorpha]|uniref:Uncharacterized protein n=1 Tax=Dreissena polymorpha TaxID=45954 RepID=A0A9D4RYH4_DREPO|nr:hypothetical protein DPMN_007578 [Dreissena polymorpha]